MPEKKSASLPASRIFLYGILIKNPVLVQVIGLCPAVAAAADIYVSAMLSILVTGLLIVCECIASLLLKHVPGRIRVAIYFLIGLLVCGEASFFLEQNAPDLLNSVGIYLPLMAASSAVALRSENFAVRKSVRLAFLDALANGIGTSLVLMTSGFVRGLLGSGKIGELQVFAEPPLRGLAMPFGGFIVLGFSAAFLNWFIPTFLSQLDAQMEFGIRKKKKKPAAKPAVQTVSAQPTDAPTQPQSSVPQETERTKPRHETAQTESAESHAAQFYDRMSEEKEDNLDSVLYEGDSFSVQEELDMILASIETFEDLLPQTKEDQDA